MNKCMYWALSGYGTNPSIYEHEEEKSKTKNLSISEKIERSINVNTDIDTFILSKMVLEKPKLEKAKKKVQFASKPIDPTESVISVVTKMDG